VNTRGGPQRIPRPDVWAPGGAPPWAILDDPAGRLDPDRLRSTFTGRVGAASPVEGNGAAPSAVLVGVHPDAHGELHVVLTRRSQHLRYHTGEVSFPGGRVEPGESMVEAALREAAEEVALDPDLAEPLGELDHLTTVTRRAYITPVVAWLDRWPRLVPSEDEVAAILHVPFRELLEPGVYREERWGAGETARPVYFFELYGDTVWGATAAMLRQFLALALDLDPGSRAQWDPAGDLPVAWEPPPGWDGSAV
jgi:8-oxo-dGTP pyrophosphatase MutT (NUDIX family)